MQPVQKSHVLSDQGRRVCITCVHGWLVPTQRAYLSPISINYQSTLARLRTATRGVHCTVQPGTQPAVPRYCFRTGLIGARLLLFVAVRHAAATCQASAAGMAISARPPSRRSQHGRAGLCIGSPLTETRPMGTGWDGDAMPLERGGGAAGQGLIPPGLGWPGGSPHPPAWWSPRPHHLHSSGRLSVWGPGRRFAVAPRVLGWWWECHTGGLVVVEGARGRTVQPPVQTFQRRGAGGELGRSWCGLEHQFSVTRQHV